MKSDVEDLKREVLKLGGNSFQIPGIIERDLHDELGRKDWAAFGPTDRRVKSVRGIPMERCRCHENAALLALHKEWECWTGLALSPDGCWRTHTWVVVPSTRRVYETTEPRTAYYGVKLTVDATKSLLMWRNGR